MSNNAAGGGESKKKKRNNTSRKKLSKIAAEAANKAKQRQSVNPWGVGPIGSVDEGWLINHGHKHVPNQIDPEMARAYQARHVFIEKLMNPNIREPEKYANDVNLLGTTFKNSEAVRKGHSIGKLAKELKASSRGKSQPHLAPDFKVLKPTLRQTGYYNNRAGRYHNRHPLKSNKRYERNHALRLNIRAMGRARNKAKKRAATVDALMMEPRIHPQLSEYLSEHIAGFAARQNNSNNNKSRASKSSGGRRRRQTRRRRKKVNRKRKKTRSKKH